MGYPGAEGFEQEQPCGNCGSTDTSREHVDVGIGIVWGPWGCPECGWSEDPHYSQLDGPTSEGGKRTDQYGWLYPAETVTPDRQTESLPEESTMDTTSPAYGTPPTVEQDPMFGEKATALPYIDADGIATTGHVAAGPSRERAQREAEDGTAAARQRSILGMLKEAGSIGLTWKEIADKTGQHHGQVSGALSAMHKEGQIVALKMDRRNGSGVYVTPEHVLGRITRPFKANRPASEPTPAAPARPTLSDAEREVLDNIRNGMKSVPSDAPVVRMKPASVRTLVRVVERLLQG